MQHTVMAKHIEVGDQLFVDGKKVVVTKVKQYPEQRKVLITTDAGQLTRTYEETVYRFESASSAREQVFAWRKRATKIT
jgi:hypothetical protein